VAKELSRDRSRAEVIERERGRRGRPVSGSHHDAVSKRLDHTNDRTEITGADAVCGGVAVEEPVGAADPQIGVLGSQHVAKFVSDVGKLTELVMARR